MASFFQKAVAGCFIFGLVFIAGCDNSDDLANKKSSLAISETEAKAIIKHYAELAYWNFEDALITAKALKVAVQNLVDNPSEITLTKARQAWKQARIPYSQSEVFRFGNAIVDNWEGQLNAWPLDEGLVDYVQADNYTYEHGNEGALANIIANETLQVGSQQTDLTVLSPELLASLNELGGSEVNVATGYHAIEFLLWGQDLNGNGPGAGNRPYTDYSLGAECTNGHCQRRGEYLIAAADLLVYDLEYMAQQWHPGMIGNYREKLLGEDIGQGLRKMLFGMGSLALGELAGERMKVALEANSPEEEQDCFSDNTHHSHYYNGIASFNVYSGYYQRADGKELNGPSIAAWVRSREPEMASRVMAAFQKTRESLQLLVDSAEKEQVAFDELIATGNQEGHALIHKNINALVAQTRLVEEVAQFMGIDQLNPDNADHDF